MKKESSAPGILGDPTVTFLTALLADVHRGVVQLPRFQRPMRWTLEQRLELLDSVARGIPIGTVMVWRTQIELATREFVGPHRVGRVIAPIHSYIIDGGQRVAALYSALYPLEEEVPDDIDEPAENFQVHYDLEEKRFVTPPVGELAEPHWLPLPKVLDTVQLLRFQRQLAGPRAEKLLSRADGVVEKIRAYKVPVIGFGSDDLDLATTTFKRVNSTGTRMSETDMLSALVWTKTFDLQDEIGSLRDEYLGPVGWAALEDEGFLRCVKATLRLDLYESPENVSAAIKEDHGALLRTAKCLVAVAAFLRDDCGIRSPALVPYSAQVPLLVLAFSEASPSEMIRSKLQAWLWLTTYAEFFASISGHRLGVVAARVMDLVKTGHFSWPGSKPFSRRRLPDRFDFRHARSRAIALALARKQGETGAQALAELGADALVRLVTRVKGADRFGNRFLSTSAQRAELLSQLRSGDPETLAQQGVTADAWRLLADGRETDFIEQRTSDLDALEVEFVDQWRTHLDDPQPGDSDPRQVKLFPDLEK